MQNEIDAGYRQVITLCHQGQFEIARAVCDHLAQRFPTEGKRIVHLRAIVEKRAGNPQGAIELLQTSIDETIEGIANQHALLRIYMRVKDWPAALDQAVEIIGSSRKINDLAFLSSAASTVAYCLIEQGRIDDARDFFIQYPNISDEERIPSSPPIPVGTLRKKLALGQGN